MLSFSKWKSIPEVNRELYAKGAKFERKLLVLAHNQFYSTFSILKDVHYDALAIKKRAALLIFKTQETET